MKPIYFGPFAVIFVVFFGLSGAAQPDNNLKTCFIDARTGDTIKATHWARLVKADFLQVNLRASQKNSQVCLELLFNLGEVEPFSVSDTNSLWLKFQNGTTMILKSRDNTTSKKGITVIPEDLSGVGKQGVHCYYPATHDQYVLLQSYLVEKIRVFSSLGYETAKLDGAGMSVIGDACRAVWFKPKKYTVMNEPPEVEAKIEEPW
jgi:hypothetical protein